MQLFSWSEGDCEGYHGTNLSTFFIRIQSSKTQLTFFEENGLICVCVAIVCRPSRNNANRQLEFDATGGFRFGDDYGTGIGGAGPRSAFNPHFSSHQSSRPQMDRAFACSFTKLGESVISAHCCLILLFQSLKGFL